MLYVLTGPNTFNKRLRISELAIQAEQVISLEAEEGLGRWFDVVGQADLFGVMPTVIGRNQLDEWPGPDIESLRQHILPRASEMTIIICCQKLAEEMTAELKEWQTPAVKVEQFAHLSQAQMMQWLKQAAIDKEVTIESRYLATLVQWWGLDQSAAQQQLELWSLGGVEKVGQEELLAAGITSEGGSVFDLTDSWAQRQTGKAIRQLHDLLNKSIDPKQIIGMLGWQIELMRASQLLQAESGTDKKPSKAFNPSALQKAGRAAKQWNEDQLLAAVNQLIDLDMSSRNGGVKDLELGLELWLYRTHLR